MPPPRGRGRRVSIDESSRTSKNHPSSAPSRPTNGGSRGRGQSTTERKESTPIQPHPKPDPGRPKESDALICVCTRGGPKCPGLSHLPERLPETPSGRSETHHGSSEIPHGTTETPHGRPETPHGRPEPPHGRPETPHGRPETPHGRPETPHGRPEAPHGRSETPHGRSEAPHGSSQASHGRSQTPQGRSQSPRGSSKASSGKSKTPHGSSNAPHGSSQTPHGRSETPHGSSQTPHGSSETPHGRSETHHGGTAPPHGRTETPHGRSEAPHGNSKSPERSGGSPGKSGKKSSKRSSQSSGSSHGSSPQQSPERSSPKSNGKSSQRSHETMHEDAPRRPHEKSNIEILSKTNPELFDRSPRPGGFLKYLVPSKSQDYIAYGGPGLLRCHCSLKPRAIKSSVKSSKSATSIGSTHSKAVRFTKDQYAHEAESGAVVYVPSKQFRMDQTTHQYYLSESYMRGDADEARLPAEMDPIHQATDLLSNTISTVMLMAAGATSIPHECYVNTKTYLNCIRDDSEQHPYNIMGILNHMLWLNQDPGKKEAAITRPTPPRQPPSDQSWSRNKRHTSGEYRSRGNPPHPNVRNNYDHMNSPPPHHGPVPSPNRRNPPPHERSPTRGGPEPIDTRQGRRGSRSRTPKQKRKSRGRSSKRTRSRGGSSGSIPPEGRPRRNSPPEGRFEESCTTLDCPELHGPHGAHLQKGYHEEVPREHASQEHSPPQSHSQERSSSKSRSRKRSSRRSGSRGRSSRGRNSRESSPRQDSTSSHIERDFRAVNAENIGSISSLHNTALPARSDLCLHSFGAPMVDWDRSAHQYVCPQESIFWSAPTYVAPQCNPSDALLGSYSRSSLRFSSSQQSLGPGKSNLRMGPRPGPKPRVAIACPDSVAGCSNSCDNRSSHPSISNFNASYPECTDYLPGHNAFYDVPSQVSLKYTAVSPGGGPLQSYGKPHRYGSPHRYIYPQRPSGIPRPIGCSQRGGCGKCGACAPGECSSGTCSPSGFYSGCDSPAGGYSGGYSPGGYSPGGYSAGGYSASGHSPGEYSPDGYSAAATPGANTLPGAFSTLQRGGARQRGNNWRFASPPHNRTPARGMPRKFGPVLSRDETTSRPIRLCTTDCGGSSNWSGGICLLDFPDTNKTSLQPHGSFFMKEVKKPPKVVRTRSKTRSKASSKPRSKSRSRTRSRTR